MPPAYVKTIREELLYEYAKLISRSVFNGEINYKFVTNRFNALREGRITISGTNREWEKKATLPRELSLIHILQMKGEFTNGACQDYFQRTDYHSRQHPPKVRR